MSDEMIAISTKIAYMEKSMNRMEVAVTNSMATISGAMVDIGITMSRLHDNTEEHKVLHKRVDDVHTGVDALNVKMAEVKTICESCKEPKEATPIRTAIITSVIIVGLTAFSALVMIHSKELIGIIF